MLPFVWPLVTTVAGAVINAISKKSGSNRSYETWQEGHGDQAYGQQRTDQGLSALDDLAGQYQQQIANGGLPEDLRRQFRMTRGSLSDSAVRLNRANLANLRQRMLTNPTFRPEAAAEYDLQNQQNVGEQLFSAQNDTNMQEANLALSNTNQLFDRLENIRRAYIGVGEDAKSRALAKIQASLGMKTASDNSNSAFLSQLIQSYMSYRAAKG